MKNHSDIKAHHAQAVSTFQALFCRSVLLSKGGSSDFGANITDENLTRICAPEVEFHGQLILRMPMAFPNFNLLDAEYQTLDTGDTEVSFPYFLPDFPMAFVIPKAWYEEIGKDVFVVLSREIDTQEYSLARVTHDVADAVAECRRIIVRKDFNPACFRMKTLEKEHARLKRAASKDEGENWKFGELSRMLAEARKYIRKYAIMPHRHAYL